MIISHDIDFVAETCERVIVMRQVVIVLDETPVATFGQFDLLHEASIVPPQISRLAHRLGLDTVCTVDAVLQELKAAKSIQVPQNMQSSAEVDAERMKNGRNE